MQKFGEKYLNGFFHSAKGLDKQQAESEDV